MRIRIIIIGAGIGGLSTAIALSKLGIDVEVYERALELREVGAGIALASNALRALDVLGLTDEVKPFVQTMQGTIRNASGKLLTSICGDLSQQIGPVAIMHRAELLTLLARHVVPARIHLGRTFAGLKQDAEGVTASFDTGEKAQADTLIGADGLRSVVR